MPWKRAAIIVLAITVASCSKKAEETPAEAEWPQNGLTEAQASEVLAKVGDRTITVGELADQLASQSPYLRARFESPARRKEFLDNAFFTAGECLSNGGKLFLQPQIFALTGQCLCPIKRQEKMTAAII